MNRLRWTFLISLAVAFIGATAIIMTAKPMYESTALIMVKRQQLEHPAGTREEVRNRWVWVRDGLELKNELVSDSELATVLSAAKADLGQAVEPSSPEQVAALRQHVNIHYSGGDDNLYTIKVTDGDPKTAVAIAKAFLSRFPDLAIGGRIQSLEQSLLGFEANRQADIVEALKNDIVLAKAERERRIITVETPFKASKIWPRPLFIYAAATCIALFLAALISVYLRKIS